MKRLRLQHFVVQPVLVWDDGETLSPGPPVQAQALTLEGAQDLVETWPSKLAELQAAAEDTGDEASPETS